MLPPCTLLGSKTFHDVSPRTITLQQSLLLSINTHLLRHRLNSYLDLDCWHPRSLQYLLLELAQSFKQIGFVSLAFFQCTFLAVKLFFQANTLPIASSQILLLTSAASLFEAEIRSVFLNVSTSFDVQHFFTWNRIIIGLKIILKYNSDLIFLNKASPLYFPHLKRLDVHLDDVWGFLYWLSR
ncbi:hypothetical protein GEMRC1_012524 [Eukaryota sp. GEM-RC1]